MDNIAACIVTYNRKELLIKCLNSIISQTQTVQEIIIVNNCSTDGTKDMLFSKGYICPINEYTSEDASIYISNYKISKTQNIQIRLIDKILNEGGAGGFYTAMKTAYELGYEWVWLMDDDGIPNNNQIEELLKKSKKYNLLFCNALVCRIDDPNQLVFGINKKYKSHQFQDNEIEYGEMNPHNGTLIHHSVMEKIGFTKKEMFIWGDEVEYMQRAIKNGYPLVTICTAIHYHPKNQSNSINIIPLLKYKKIRIPNPKFSHHYYRNLGYIKRNYESYKKVLKCFISYSLTYLIRLNFKEYYKFIKYYSRGVRNRYN